MPFLMPMAALPRGQSWRIARLPKKGEEGRGDEGEATEGQWAPPFWRAGGGVVDVVEPTHWVEVSKCNALARRMADRHYSYRSGRKRPRGPEVGPPGNKIILLCPDGKAVWGSHRPDPTSGLTRPDGIDAWCCFIFRNEGCEVQSSLLIRQAIWITTLKWGIAPAGFVTYVAAAKVASPNPGYCFLKAGFEPAGWTLSSYLGQLRRLIMSPDAIESLTEFKQAVLL